MSPGRCNTSLTTPRHAEYQIINMILGNMSNATHQAMPSEVPVDSKTRSSKKNNGRKEKLSERDRRVLKRIATSKMITTATKVTTELYQHLDQGWVHVWRAPAPAYGRDCLFPTVKHGGGSVII
ncbi:hypothetical protein TNCV_3231901 [Trichonephila clavipes]|nr:hypothetical protein TNCV_3231901 [Trichonephila clavipes]